jgi:hypothetical protein
MQNFCVTLEWQRKVSAINVQLLCNAGMTKKSTAINVELMCNAGITKKSTHNKQTVDPPP